MTAHAQSSSRLKITVSVVTHNNSTCLPEFLDSLNGQSGVEWNALFFDNASSDNTVALLKERGEQNIHASDANLGYGRAHNFNLARSSSEYFVALNADLSFGAGVLQRLANHLDAHAGEAIAGPYVLEGPDRTPFPPRRFYPGEGMIPIELGMRRPEIAWINGCCMIARRSVLEAVGGFDEDYFLYQAETDLCLRVRRAGHRIGHCDDAVVHHLHRQSQRGISEYEYGRRLFEGSSVFWRKHYSATDVAAIARFQHRVCGLFLGFGKSFEKLTRRPAFGHERLRARRDVCGDLMRSSELRGCQRRWRPIVLRQSRLAVEWVLKGQFPLDDY